MTDKNILAQLNYTVANAHWEDIRRLVLLLIPILFGNILFVFYLLVSGNIQNWTINIFTFSTGIVILCILNVLAILVPFQIARRFFYEFYRPTSNNVMQLVMRQIIGKPVLPIFRRIWKYPRVQIKNAKLEPLDHWVFWLGGPALLIVEYAAVYLERGNRFSRVAGPGLVFLRRHEVIRKIIDLRPQVLDHQSISAWTNDGIKIEVKLTITFQIGKNPQDPDDPYNYPSDPIAVRKAVENNPVRYDTEGGLIENSWQMGAFGPLRGLLGNYIASHSFDELILDDVNSEDKKDATSIKKKRIKNSKLASYIDNELLNKLNESSDFTASDLLREEIIFPQKVDEVLYRIWKKKSQKENIIKDGWAKANQERARDKAWRDSQRELIESIKKGVDKISNNHFADVFQLAYSEIIDRAHPALRPQLAQKTFEFLDEFKDLFQFPGDS